MGSHGSDTSDAAAEAVLVALRRIVRFLRVSDRNPHDLSPAQLFVLHVLAGHPASSLAEVARRTLTDQSSVSTVVAKLVDRKLVARTTSRLDRRRAELTLTAAGQRIAAATPQLPQVAIVDAIRAMPAKRRTDLVGALEHLTAAIGADALSPQMFELDAPEPKKSRRAS